MNRFDHDASTHLILGGARSGKSRYAESLAVNCAQTWLLPLVYFATASADDDEMQARIDRHRKDRDSRWHVVEEPLDIVKEINQLPSESVVLVDCLTLWLSNCLHQRPKDWPTQKSELLDTLSRSQHRIFLVSNEISLGVVPMGELSRRFVDELGWLHQDLAQQCQQVTMVIAGLPQSLK